jgi:purine nucleosidase
MRSFLIDTDTASDDAVALIMALRYRDVEVKAITVVAGNVSLEQGCRNALYTVELCGKNVRVYAGAVKPLVRELEDARWFHGRDGLGDQNYPAPKSVVAKGDAIDVIIETARSNPGLTLVTLGPLTNIALALGRAPELAKNVGRCVVMGGNPCCEGNVTPAAEFNIYVDPEAASMVFRLLPVEMIGWQLSRGESVVNESEMGRLREMNTTLATFCLHCNCRAVEAFKEQTGEEGIGLPDPVAMAVALEPGVCLESSEHRVEIETASELTRGQTVVDRLNVSSDVRNRGAWSSGSNSVKSKVCWKIDVPRWKQILFDSLR